MPKKIFYCVDFHCPAGGMLDYDGSSGRLDGRRGPRGYLRETDAGTPVSGILAAFTWAKKQGMTDGMIQIASSQSKDGLFVFKFADGTFSVVKEDGGKFSTELDKVGADKVKDAFGKSGSVVVLTSDEIAKIAPANEAEENGGVEEDDMLKNRPHNLHRADEGEKVAASVKKAAEGLYEKDGDELNESFVKFATGLIEG